MSAERSSVLHLVRRPGDAYALQIARRTGGLVVRLGRAAAGDPPADIRTISERDLSADQLLALILETPRVIPW